jgi:hypothetical protein
MTPIPTTIAARRATTVKIATNTAIQQQLQEQQQL